MPETPWERARGLLGTTGPAPGTGLLLERARSMHTIGMRAPIVVVFLDAELRVLSAIRVPPGRVLLPRRRARHLLELGSEVTRGVPAGGRAGGRALTPGPPAPRRARPTRGPRYTGRAPGGGCNAPIV